MKFTPPLNLRFLANRYASLKLNSTFEWSRNDCNTLVIAYIELISKPDYSLLATLDGKYNSLKEAIYFYSDMNLTWEMFLQHNLFCRDSMASLKVGDVMLHSSIGAMKSTSIYLGNNKNLIADEHKGVCVMPTVELLTFKDLEVYRYVR